MSTEYEAILRGHGTDTVEVNRIYQTTLVYVRWLVTLTALTAEEKLAQIERLLAALEAVQEHLDRREG